MMKLITIIAILIFYQVSAAGERFDLLKQNLSQAGCWQFEFMTVIESDIFSTVDSADGSAVIASDNRYWVNVGDDSFWYDSKLYYSYSVDANQLIIEKGDISVESEMSFIVRLDDFYKSYTVDDNKKYRLIRHKDIEGDVPDSLVVNIDSKKLEIRSIEYYDINEELNRIIFKKQLFNPQCFDSSFVPNLPDSVERVKL